MNSWDIGESKWHSCNRTLETSPSLPLTDELIRRDIYTEEYQSITAADMTSWMEILCEFCVPSDVRVLKLQSSLFLVL